MSPGSYSRPPSHDGSGGSSTNHDHVIGIVDDSLRIGKEERVAMKMAVQDFTEATNHTLILHIVSSSTSDPMKAALSGKYNCF